MTEAEWDACADPHAMQWHIENSGRAADRKLRLWAVACAHKVLDCLEDVRSKAAVETAERYADELATREDLRAAHADGLQAEYDAQERAYQSTPHTATDSAASFASAAAFYAAGHVVFIGEAANSAADAASWQGTGRTDKSRRVIERAAQADLLRCVFGLPLGPVVFDAAWLTWNDDTVRKTAQAIYDTRAFDRLPLLADALEEAGCTDAAILAHCRRPGEHVRGCWVVDALLGKS